MIKLATNITEEASRNYYYLWLTYNHEMRNFTLFCLHDSKGKCSEKPQDFTLATRKSHFETVRGIRNNPGKGQVIEGEVTSPPCENPKIVKEFKINQICDFIVSVSSNHEAFLKLMKFSKQSPVFLEETDEYSSIFSAINASFGYTLKRSGRTDEVSLTIKC